VNLKHFQFMLLLWNDYERLNSEDFGSFNATEKLLRQNAAFVCDYLIFIFMMKHTEARMVVEPAELLPGMFQ